MIVEVGEFKPILFQIKKFGRVEPGLNPIKINLSSDKFSDKNMEILNPPIFSKNLRNFQTNYFAAAGWTDFEKFSSEYFDRKICGNCQKSQSWH